MLKGLFCETVFSECTILNVTIIQLLMVEYAHLTSLKMASVDNNKTNYVLYCIELCCLINLYTIFGCTIYICVVRYKNGLLDVFVVVCVALVGLSWKAASRYLQKIVVSKFVIRSVKTVLSVAIMDIDCTAKSCCKPSPCGSLSVCTTLLYWSHYNPVREIWPPCVIILCLVSVHNVCQTRQHV